MPLSDYITSPASFRLVQEMAALQSSGPYDHSDYHLTMFGQETGVPRHSGHPSFGHLSLLVFEAVLEVVCVSLPGYIIARHGHFDAESQKFLANLNVMLFTPCLIFTKLASQLTAEKMGDLAIIPAIFVVQTLISYMCALTVSKVMGFKKRQANFVIAMGVFGNSNSLPISLVLSLSKTLKGLHWDKVPGDNDNEVGARGILYLMIFQQLGQLVRWTWGYNVLLAPADKYTEEQGGTMYISEAERGRHAYRDEVDDDDVSERSRLLSPSSSEDYGSTDYDTETRVGNSPPDNSKDGLTPTKSHTSLTGSTLSLEGRTEVPNSPELMPTPANGNIAPHKTPEINRHDEEAAGFKGAVNRFRNHVSTTRRRAGVRVAKAGKSVFDKLPRPLAWVLRKVWNGLTKFLAGLWEFMNPPLWAMLVAIVVASVPQLQHLFFDNGTFVRNSVTRAVEQSGGVAVPLILVVLGGNLARNTLPKEEKSLTGLTDPKEETRLLIASLISRMVLPTIIMAPLLALMAKYLSVSILEDKIFIVVCFLLTGAPTALQLAQICQINNVYMPVMSNILFQSYVIWILPSTLILVLLALETVEWASLPV